MTPAQAMDVGERLINLLSQQRLLYRQLQELAQKQSRLVDGSDPEMLLRVLAARQRLINKLSAIDHELEPIRADWKKIAQALPEGQRQEALALVASVQEILGAILVNDEKDTKALNNQRQRVSSEIRDASAGKRVNQAYTQNTAPSCNSLFDTVNEH